MRSKTFIYFFLQKNNHNFRISLNLNAWKNSRCAKNFVKLSLRKKGATFIKFIIIFFTNFYDYILTERILFYDMVDVYLSFLKLFFDNIQVYISALTGIFSIDYFKFNTKNFVQAIRSCCINFFTIQKCFFQFKNNFLYTLKRKQEIGI